jgi:hypothetical protein
MVAPFAYAACQFPEDSTKISIRFLKALQADKTGSAEFEFEVTNNGVENIVLPVWNEHGKWFMGAPSAWLQYRVGASGWEDYPYSAGDFLPEPKVVVLEPGKKSTILTRVGSSIFSKSVNNLIRLRIVPKSPRVCASSGPFKAAIAK